MDKTHNSEKTRVQKGQSEPQSVEEYNPYRQWGRRITAIGFIFLILQGNVWVARYAFGAPIPNWFGVLWLLFIILVVLGGLVLGVGRIMSWMTSLKSSEKQ